jgi:hypothetical protein
MPIQPIREDILWILRNWHGWQGLDLAGLLVDLKEFAMALAFFYDPQKCGAY